MDKKNQKNAPPKLIIWYCNYLLYIISTFAKRDFLMCGYTDTLKELEKVMASKGEIQTTQN